MVSGFARPRVTGTRPRVTCELYAFQPSLSRPKDGGSDLWRTLTRMHLHRTSRESSKAYGLTLRRQARGPFFSPQKEKTRYMFLLLN